MKKCSVVDCKKQLDKNGRPLDFCDWQQGRCPMQKEKLDTVGYAVLLIMITTLTLILWLTT